MQVILKAIDHQETLPTLRRVRRIITISEMMKKVYEATGEERREREGGMRVRGIKNHFITFSVRHNSNSKTMQEHT